MSAALLSKRRWRRASLVRRRCRVRVPGTAQMSGGLVAAGRGHEGADTTLVTGHVPMKRRWRRTCFVSRGTGFDSRRGLCGVEKQRFRETWVVTHLAHNQENACATHAPATPVKHCWRCTCLVSRGHSVRIRGQARTGRCELGYPPPNTGGVALGSAPG